MSWLVGAMLLAIILLLLVRLKRVEAEKRELLAGAREAARAERERAERLEREFAWARTLCQMMPLPVLVVDRQMEMRYANPAAEALFGSMVAGEGAIVRLRHSGLVEGLEQAYRRGRIEPVTIELQDRQFIIHAAAWPEAEAPAGTVLLMQDVTQLMQLSRARREMASNLSHELRTPLTSIRLMCETLLDGMPEEQAFHQKLVRRVGAETEAMIRLVEDLTALSRIESGRTSLRLEPANLRELLEARVERLTSQIDLKRLAVRIDCRDDLAVPIDPERFGQVLTNILDNAIKHSPESGTITIAVEQGEGESTLSVRDEGPGIAPADLPRIFERFYKGDRARQRAQLAGTGLGLSIAKHLVEAHGGSLRASNHPQRGAIFTITLPMEEVASAEPLSDTRSESTESAPARRPD